MDGEIRYCLAEENAQLGTLLADNAYCSVYQSGNGLYWAVKDMASERFFVHLYTNHPERLPQKRQPYGFDNLDFRFEAREIETIDDRRTACRELPEGYPIAYIQTGMYDANGVIWMERFRPLTEARCEENDRANTKTLSMRMISPNRGMTARRCHSWEMIDWS